MYIPPFHITEKILHLVSEISEQVGLLYTQMSSDAPSPQLRRKNQIKTIHSSLAIENNTLSIKQMTDIIEGKRVLGPPDLSAMQNYEDKEEDDKLELHDKLHDKFPELSAKAVDVLEAIQKSPGYSANQLGGQIGLSERQVKTYITKLKQLGLIVRIGSNKTGYWKVTIV